MRGRSTAWCSSSAWWRTSGWWASHRFLRHVSRCRALVEVVDLSAADPRADLDAARRELQAYDADVAARPALVVGTKADLVEDAPDRARRLDPEAIAVSGITGRGIEELQGRLSALLSELPDEERTPHVVLRPGRPAFQVIRQGERFRVRGQRVERWVAETDLEDPRQVAELQRQLSRAGVERQLAEAGARRGDEVLIGDRAFEFIPEDEETGT